MLENGTYTLSVDPKGVELDYLHLIDNLTGEDVDLLAPVSASESEAIQEPVAYTFTAKTTDYASRFKLVFSTDEKDGVSLRSARGRLRSSSQRRIRTYFLVTLFFCSFL